MSTRSKLRKLSRKIPSDSEVSDILTSLADKDDLHIAILGTALVEAKLEKLIRKKLADQDTGLADRLFQDGPLSDFNSKILIARAFGLINVRVADELDMIRHARNAFAHAKVPLTFETDVIAQHINEAALMKSHRAADAALDTPLNLSNKDAFLILSEFVLFFLHEMAEYPGPADEAFGHALVKIQGL